MVEGLKVEVFSLFILLQDYLALRSKVVWRIDDETRIFCSYLCFFLLCSQQCFYLFTRLCLFFSYSFEFVLAFETIDIEIATLRAC